MLTILLILVLVLMLGGYGYGWRGGSLEPGGVIGILMAIVIIVLLLSLLGPLVHGFWYSGPLR